MKFPTIDAILFDMGRTLRYTVKKPAIQETWLKKLLPLTRLSCTTTELADLLTQRAQAYKLWGEKSLVELNPAEIWQQWLLPEESPEYIQSNYLEMNRYWRKAIGEGALFPDASNVIVTLFQRGYRLAIVSNTVSSEETPKLLEKYGLTRYFETVVLSCNYGTRKPSAAIFHSASGYMGVEPYHCAYVGDQIDRDIYGSKIAGFAASIYFDHGDNTNSVDGKPQAIPDEVIHSLSELLDIFPDRYQNRPVAPTYLGNVAIQNPWNVSLSTMWMVENKIPLDKSLQVLDDLGLNSLEINHSIRTHDLTNIDLAPLPIRSLHEPCPADVSLSTLSQKDWLVSSPDEKKRQQGVRMIMRSIDLADRLGVHHIVVHPGTVGLSNTEEKKLRKLIEAGLGDSAEAENLRHQMRNQRVVAAAERIRAVKLSLAELLEYIGTKPIHMALENRYHYMDIPSPSELGELLELADSEKIGFQFDIGHARALDRMGFYPMQEWLEKYGNRILGVHLHDVVMLEDHAAPGKGDIDYSFCAQYIPAKAQRTLEVRGYNSILAIREGLELLADKGIVSRME